ncbi:hypothetical protein [Chitinophaga solisilvae]|uniref:hypothetical protein n=1 Tax=Chitinophaga solisilvae TaxID=1233460 RepID=UPI001371F4E6|nr:hypothetical protein [Chitinophaga solisilvae]
MKKVSLFLAAIVMACSTLPLQANSHASTSFGTRSVSRINLTGPSSVKLGGVGYVFSIKILPDPFPADARWVIYKDGVLVNTINANGSGTISLDGSDFGSTGGFSVELISTESGMGYVIGAKSVMVKISF